MEYLVLADDFTGALDTGIQLCHMGLMTKVVTYSSMQAMEEYFSSDIPALVINTNTRHEEKETAFLTVQSICWAAKEDHVRLIYKKTDSALRGNIDAEIEAVASTGYKKVYFIPAYPKLRRTTIAGTQYISGVPIHKSPFGKDLFNPIQTAYIPEVVSINPLRHVEVIPSDQDLDEYRAPNGLIIFDAETDERLYDIAQWISKQPHDYALAGCAGFAAYLQPLLSCNCKTLPYKLQKYSGLLVISGSLHKLSFEQIEYAESVGFQVVTTEEFHAFTQDDNGAITEELALTILKIYKSSHRLIIQTAGSDIEADNRYSILKTGETISNNFGKLSKYLFAAGFDGLLVVSGGDTLNGIVKSLGNCSVEPIDEIEPGVVLANLDTDKAVRQIVAKSGGMGSKKVYQVIEEFIKRKQDKNGKGDERS